MYCPLTHLHPILLPLSTAKNNEDSVLSGDGTLSSTRLWSPIGRYIWLGGLSGVVNSLDFCPASLKSLGCFYFRCVPSSLDPSTAPPLSRFYREVYITSGGRQEGLWVSLKQRDLGSIPVRLYFFIKKVDLWTQSCCDFNNNNNVHLSCAHQRPERSHDTY